MFYFEFFRPPHLAKMSTHAYSLPLNIPGKEASSPEVSSVYPLFMCAEMHLESQSKYHLFPTE